LTEAGVISSAVGWHKLFVGIRGDKDFKSKINGRPKIWHEFRFELRQYQSIYFHKN